METPDFIDGQQEGQIVKGFVIPGHKKKMKATPRVVSPKAITGKKGD